MEEKINIMYGHITDRLKIKDMVHISTCNHPNWDIEEHFIMPKVADKLRSEGYTVKVDISYGVTDYVILNK